MVRAEQLMSNAAFENAQTYADRMRRVLDALCADLSGDRVNLVVGHLFVHGGHTGGGERQAHLADEYGISAVDFPPTAQYVALGHLHRPQQMLGSTAIHYCGSPLQLDFGEARQPKQVNLVELEPGIPAKVRAHPLSAGRTLQTIRGSMADVAAQVEAMDSDALGNSWFRVRLLEPSRSGLADDVRALLGSAVVDIRVERDGTETTPRRSGGGERSPREMFADYLADRGADDPAVEKRFAQLHDEVHDGTRSGAVMIDGAPDGPSTPVDPAGSTTGGTAR
jgi:exonuclease SbcD